MKIKEIISIVGVAGMLGWQAVAQENNAVVQTNASESQTALTTNTITGVQDLRIVNGQVYDVTTSKKWVSITIPAGSRLLNAQMIKFTGEIQARQVNLAFPHSLTASQWPTVEISNFPYNPKYFFRATDTGIYTSVPLTLRVFPLSHPQTNYDALGQPTIRPARPIFDFGLPSTNSPT